MMMTTARHPELHPRRSLLGSRSPRRPGVGKDRGVQSGLALLVVTTALLGSLVGGPSPADAAVGVCDFVPERTELGFVPADWTPPSNYVFDPDAPVHPRPGTVAGGNPYLSSIDRVAPGQDYRFGFVQLIECTTATPDVSDFFIFGSVYLYYDYSTWDPYGFQHLLVDVSDLPLRYYGAQQDGDEFRMEPPTEPLPQVAPLGGIDGKFYFVRAATWPVQIKSEPLTTDPEGEKLWGFEIASGGWWGSEFVDPDVGNISALMIHVAPDPLDDGEDDDSERPTVGQNGEGGLAVACSPTVVRVGETITCSVSRGPADVDVRWRAAYNPVFAEGVMRLGADGTGSVSFVVPRAAIGAEVTLEFMAWTSPLVIGVAGSEVPTSVPAGEGPVLPAGTAFALLLGLVVLVGFFVRGVRRRGALTG
jgi:hypothetical protein